ncbi:MAG: L,D-transpeptidase family protein [Gammaproteobacteria bacterium]|nr:L,D-transpeptidase family protein [Gammaproteobacteria bacterium]
MKHVLPTLILSSLAATAQAADYSLPSSDDAVIGELRLVKARYEDTLYEVARQNNLGFEELVDSNPQVDRWMPSKAEAVTLPTQYILPEGSRSGIVINLAEYRMYYFPAGSEIVKTFPIGIGKEGWLPGKLATKVVSKKENPDWIPPASIRREQAALGNILPPIVKAGPDNPLGDYMMKLGYDSYGIHGTREPQGVGMRVSHGCIRMFPEDIQYLFPQIPLGTAVRIINEPYKLGMRDGVLYLEAHRPLLEQTSHYRPDLNTQFNELMTRTEKFPVPIQWSKVRQMLENPDGVPRPISEPLGTGSQTAAR